MWLLSAHGHSSLSITQCEREGYLFQKLKFENLELMIIRVFLGWWHGRNTTQHANAVLLSSVRNLTGYTSHYAPFVSLGTWATLKIRSTLVHRKKVITISLFAGQIVVTATSRAQGKGEMTLNNPVCASYPNRFPFLVRYPQRAHPRESSD